MILVANEVQGGMQTTCTTFRLSLLGGLSGFLMNFEACSSIGNNSTYKISNTVYTINGTRGCYAMKTEKISGAVILKSFLISNSTKYSLGLKVWAD